MLLKSRYYVIAATHTMYQLYYNRIIKPCDMKNCVFAMLSVLIITGCSKSSDTPGNGGGNPPPIDNPPGPNDVQITSVNLTYGYTNNVIQITGKNFGTDKTALVVKVNNAVAAIINSVITDTDFSIKVPAKCGTGTITVTKAGKTAVGPQFYYIPSVTVTTLYGKADVGNYVNGTGTNMRMNTPVDFAFDKNDNLYVVERGGILGAPPGSMITKITASTGQKSTFSGGPLNGNVPNNTNVTWTVGLPGNVSSSVNGGDARYNLANGIVISTDPNSNAFKLFVTQNNFVRVVNEATATGVFAGNPKDTLGGGGSPKEGGRHEAHIFPLSNPVIFPNGTDYGSPTLYWLDAGPRIVKQDINGNISTLVDLTGVAGGGFLAEHPDGSIYLHTTITQKIVRLTSTGAISTWINTTDSVLNRASGKKELFSTQVDAAPTRAFDIDKDGNVFFVNISSLYTTLYKFFPDKSFLRLFQWHNDYTYTDGVNDQADMAGPIKIIVRNNGDIYCIDGYAIRKMTFE